MLKIIGHGVVHNKKKNCQTHAVGVKLQIIGLKFPKFLMRFYVH